MATAKTITPYTDNLRVSTLAYFLPKDEAHTSTHK